MNGGVGERIRGNSDYIKAGVVVVVMVLLVLTLFFVQASLDNSQSSNQDRTIRQQYGEISRLTQAYAQLRDQDFSIGIVPAAPTLAQVENPGTPTETPPKPTSFTVEIPDPQVKGGKLFYTCIDRSSSGNYTCAPPTTPAAKK